MTQQKAAASLSSALFARKGKASPASLLISEMEAANGGGPGAGGKPVANGAARRRPKPEADLPLLAYVEAQSESGSENLGESDSGNEPGDGSAAAEDVVEAAAPAAAAALDKAELAPAASLLERGAKPLRRANGVKPAPVQPEQSDAGPIVAQADLRDQGRAEDDTLEAEAVEPVEAETVSGDANVAAIEDAVDDDGLAGSEATQAVAETVEAEAEPVEAEPAEADAVVAAPAVEEAAQPDPAAPAEVAVAAAQPDSDAPAAATPPRAVVANAAQDKAAAAIAASVALRHAKTLNAAPALRRPAPSLAAEKPQAAPPRPRVAGQPSRSYLWRGAAVVALGAALGLGAYMIFAGQPAQPPAPVAAAQPEAPAETPADATAEAPAETLAEAPPAAAPQTEAAAVEAAPAATAAAEPAAASAAPLPEPSFDIIRIEPDGQSIIAGRAEPLSEWILLNNGTPIASVRADLNGEWVVLPDASLVPGANAFSLVPKTERGKVAIPAPQEAPANGAATGEAPAAPSPTNEAEAPLAPRGDVQGAAPAAAPSASQLAGLLLPKPKPLLETAAAETPAVAGAIQVAPDGAYEVQLASVRQTADAARERDRLATAFPRLLGQLDLRVQEAVVEGAGTFYRVRSGAIADLGVARDICRQLEAGGQGCLVVRRADEPAAPEPVTEVVEEVPAEPALSAAGQQAERPQ